VHEELAAARAADDLFGSEDEDDAADESTLTSYQRRQRQLRRQMREAEQRLVEDKGWQLKGETSARHRPKNSLLEAYLEYDVAAKAAPEVTVEKTMELEDLIRQRVLDAAWDDVEPRDDPGAMPLVSQAKLPDLSQEQGKQGLADLYEEDYLRKVAGYQPEPEERKKEKEITALFKRLCHKLDALSNYQFRPKPHIPELAVQSTAPAIAMEEVLPVTVSDAQGQAPEEVHGKKRGREQVTRGEDEASREEKKAARRAKKKAHKRERQEKEAKLERAMKLNPALGGKYARKKMADSLRMARNVTTGKAAEGQPASFAKSTQFFAKLQEDARQAVQGAQPEKKRRRKENAGGKSASFKS